MVSMYKSPKRRVEKYIQYLVAKMFLKLYQYAKIHANTKISEISSF